MARKIKDHFWKVDYARLKAVDDLAQKEIPHLALIRQGLRNASQVKSLLHMRPNLYRRLMDLAPLYAAVIKTNQPRMDEINQQHAEVTEQTMAQIENIIINCDFHHESMEDHDIEAVLSYIRIGKDLFNREFEIRSNLSSLIMMYKITRP